MDDWSNRVDEQALQGELRDILTRARSTRCPPSTGRRWSCTTSRVSNPEIAETLGISLPAVKSRVHRSRLFVRKRWPNTSRPLDAVFMNEGPRNGAPTPPGGWHAPAEPEARLGSCVPWGGAANDATIGRPPRS